jgi:hypothetical protein
MVNYSHEQHSSTDQKVAEFLERFSFIFFVSPAEDDDSLYEFASRVFDTSQRYNVSFISQVLHALLITINVQEFFSTSERELFEKRHDALEEILHEALTSRTRMMHTPGHQKLSRPIDSSYQAYSDNPEILEKFHHLLGMYHPSLNPDIDDEEERMS